MDTTDLDIISFQIIANAGDARSLSFQALDAAKAGEFDRADELIKKAKEALDKAHKAQTDILFSEMNGECKTLNMLLVHSQDHLMTAMLAMELIQEMIDMYKKGVKREKQVDEILAQLMSGKQEAGRE